LAIDQEGKVKKFVKQVEHVTFSGAYAVSKNQPVLYVTERCVFKLTEAGMELLEIAPGIDIDKDILQQMDFTPVINGHLALDGYNGFSAPNPWASRGPVRPSPWKNASSTMPHENLFFVNSKGTRFAPSKISKMSEHRRWQHLGCCGPSRLCRCQL
jgi:propionate CoA-transferase